MSTSTGSANQTSRFFDNVGLIAGREITTRLREELDYRVEMDNMAAMRAALGRGAVRIPRVFTELSTSRLIVMERFDAQDVGAIPPGFHARRIDGPERSAPEHSGPEQVPERAPRVGPLPEREPRRVQAVPGRGL